MFGMMKGPNGKWSVVVVTQLAASMDTRIWHIIAQGLDAVTAARVINYLNGGGENGKMHADVHKALR